MFSRKKKYKKEHTYYYNFLKRGTNMTYNLKLTLPQQ